MNSRQSQVPIVAIGNPGAGKSSILNSLAGQKLFESGISLGSGLTNQLDEKTANSRTFIDTPGVADDTYREAAGEALTKIFNQGGLMKILFFVTQKTGRIVAQDVATMKLVLDAVPDIGRNYGIIVNKIPKPVLSQMTEEKMFTTLVVSLFNGIKDECKHDNILLVPEIDKLNNINNAVLDPSDTIHQDLVDFIDFKIPDARITKGKITNIPVDTFEQLNKELEDLQSQLKKNQEIQTAQTDKLVAQLEAVQKENMKKQEGLKTTHENELERIDGSIKRNEVQMMNLGPTSECQWLKMEKEELEKDRQMLQEAIIYQQQQAAILQEKQMSRQNGLGGILCGLGGFLSKMIPK